MPDGTAELPEDVKLAESIRSNVAGFLKREAPDTLRMEFRILDAPKDTTHPLTARIGHYLVAHPDFIFLVTSHTEPYDTDPEKTLLDIFFALDQWRPEIVSLEFVDRKFPDLLESNGFAAGAIKRVERSRRTATSEDLVIFDFVRKNSVLR